MNIKLIILFWFLSFFNSLFLWSQELPKSSVKNSFYMLPIFEEMRKQGELTYDEKNEQMLKMKEELGEGNLYHALGFSMIYSPSYPEINDICYLSQKNGLHLGFIFDFQSHTRDDYANVAMTDLRLFQWRIDGETWEGELTDDRRGYRIPTPSRYATKLIDFNRQKTQEWAKGILDLMDKYPGVIAIVNGPIEEELAGGGVHDVTKIGDYSPYAITEFRDWLRHTGIYDDVTGKYAGEGAGSLIIGDLIDFNGVLRSQFYDDPSPDDNNGTGVSFNVFFGTQIFSWTLKYWDLSLYPDAITDPDFNLTPDNGKGYYARGFDAPRTPDMNNVFWRAWSYEIEEVDSYPPGNPDNPAFGFRQVLVKHYIEDLFDILEESGIPPDMMYPHQIPDEVLHDVERELAAASPSWTGLLKKPDHIGITRFGFIDPEILTQYAGLWGIFEWHTMPSADPQSEELYDVSTEHLNTYYTNNCQTLWPGWWKVNPPEPGTTFPLNDSKFAEAIHDFMIDKKEMPFYPGENEQPDYDPPQVRGVAAVFYDNGKLTANWNEYIWEGLSARWQDWHGFDHFQVQWSSDGVQWNSQDVSNPEIILSLEDTSYFVRVRSVSKAGKYGSWSEETHSVRKIGHTPWQFYAEYDSLKAYNGLLNLITIKNVGEDLDTMGMNVEIKGTGFLQNTIPVNRQQLELFWPMSYMNEVQNPNGLESKIMKGGVFSTLISAKQPVDPYFFLPVNTFNGQQLPYISFRIYVEKETIGQLYWFYDDVNASVKFDLHPGWQVINLENIPEWVSVPNISKIRLDLGDLPLNHIMIDWFSISSVAPSQQLKTDIVIQQKHLIELLTSPSGEPGSYKVIFNYNQQSDSIEIVTYENNVLPVVTITKPAADTTVEAGKKFTLEVEANDPDGEIRYVNFYQNGTFFYRLFDTPYNLNVTPPDEQSDYEIVVHAVDNTGITGVSQPVLVHTIKQEPFINQQPHIVPGVVEAEDYDIGGNNISYYDTDTINEGGQYRSDYVDIGKLDKENIYYVGWTNPGEWLEYTIHTDSVMKATINIRLAYGADDGEFHFEVDEKRITPNLFIKNTGDDFAFTEMSIIDLTLPAGTHQLRLSFDRGHPNVDKFEIKKYYPFRRPPISEGHIIAYPNPATEYIRFAVGVSKEREVVIYNIAGMPVKSLTLQPARLYKINVEDLKPGVYVIKVKSKDSELVGKFVKY